MFLRRAAAAPAVPTGGEAEIERAEARAVEVERELRSELDGLRASWAELGARLGAAKAQAAKAQLAGIRSPELSLVSSRLQAIELAEPEPRPELARALQARAEAVDLRLRLDEATGLAVRSRVAGLAKLAADVARQLEALRAIEAASAREAAVTREAAAAREAAARKQVPTARAASGPDERRQHPRVELGVSVDLHSDSNFFTGFASDLSQGGLFVATVQPVPIGTEVGLSFTLPGGEQTVMRGIVRWTRELNDATPEVFPGVGVQFAPLAPEVRAAVEQFVQSREPMFFPD